MTESLNTKLPYSSVTLEAMWSRFLFSRWTVSSALTGGPVRPARFANSPDVQIL